MMKREVCFLIAGLLMGLLVGLPNQSTAYQETGPSIEDRMDAAELRLDNQRQHYLKIEDAIHDWTYHTLTGSVKACQAEIDKFGAIPATNFKDRIWRLREALDQHNKRTAIAANHMESALTGKEYEDEE